MANQKNKKKETTLFLGKKSYLFSLTTTNFLVKVQIL